MLSGVTAPDARARDPDCRRAFHQVGLLPATKLKSECKSSRLRQLGACQPKKPQDKSGKLSFIYFLVVLARFAGLLIS